jgi:hypothetical protein
MRSDGEPALCKHEVTGSIPVGFHHDHTPSSTGARQRGRGCSGCSAWLAPRQGCNGGPSESGEQEVTGSIPVDSTRGSDTGVFFSLVSATIVGSGLRAMAARPTRASGSPAAPTAPGRCACAADSAPGSMRCGRLAAVRLLRRRARSRRRRTCAACRRAFERRLSLSGR